MDYVATYPTTCIPYHSSNMILNVDSDDAYLVSSKVQSRVADYFQLNSLHKTHHHQAITGAIYVERKILWHISSLVAEAETARVYHNAQKSIPIQTILTTFYHPQPPTLVKTNNSTTNGFIRDNIHQKRSNLWDMRYCLLTDRKSQ